MSKIKTDIDYDRIHEKYLIIDCHAPSWSVCFYRNVDFKTPERDYLNGYSFTYNVNYAMTFDSINDASDYIEQNKNQEYFLCPAVVDYRVAIGIAYSLVKTHTFKTGTHEGDYIC